MPEDIPTIDGPAEEVELEPLHRRRPAELTTFLAGLLVLAGAAGLDLSEEVLLAAVAVIAGLPAVISWIVDVVRDSLR